MDEDVLHIPTLTEVAEGALDNRSALRPTFLIRRGENQKGGRFRDARKSIPEPFIVYALNVLFHNRSYSPVKFGARFSAKAWRPSA